MNNYIDNKEKFANIVQKYQSDYNLISGQLNEFKDDMICFGIDKTVAAKIALVFELTNVGSYLLNHSLSSVDINNCVINVEEQCGFSKNCCQEILTLVFSAFGFENIAECLKNGKTINFTKDKSLKSSRHIYSLDEYENVLNEVNDYLTKCWNRYNDSSLLDKKDALSKVDTSIIRNNSELISKLAEQDHPLALCIRGKCYLYGIGTEQSDNIARGFLDRASKAGSIEADGLLGDYYYDKMKYTDAYNYYTSIGAVSLYKGRQNRLSAILDNKKLNIKLLAGMTLYYVINFIYLVFVMTGKFCPSSCTHYPTSILALLISTLLFIFAVVRVYFKRFDSPKLILTIQFCVSCLFTFAALVL